jgi:hypothetical protein
LPCAQKLHYTPKLIKTLKPTKALLIVENELHAYYDHDGANGAEDGQLEGVQERRTQWKTKLDALVKENEALIQQQQQQKERHKEHERPEKLQEQEDVQMETEDMPTYMYEVIEVTLPSAYSSSTSTTISTTKVLKDIQNLEIWFIV